ncbi:MAG: hypothetical protein LUQ32_01345 [Methanomicrobiales archaeon]|nr:hypothetical protein [Methanomicrobiales archaeon]
MLCIVVCLGLVLALPTVTHLRFVIWLALGLVIYFFYGMKNARAAGSALDSCDGANRPGTRDPGA